MESNVQIERIELEDYGIFVTFTDATCAGYVIEELLRLRPIRLPAEGCGSGFMGVASDSRPAQKKNPTG
jgi:hypothetical protein